MSVEMSLDLRRDNIFDKVFLWIASIFFISTVILATLQVMNRTFDLGLPLLHIATMSRILLVIGTFFGAAVAARNNQHIKITIFLEYIKERSVKAYDIISGTNQVIIITFLIIAIYSVALAGFGNMNTNVSGLPGEITMGHLYFAIMVGLSLYLLFELLKLGSKLPIPTTTDMRRKFNV